MPNKYLFKNMFDVNSFKKGFGKLETQLKEIDTIIKNLGKGTGIKNVDVALNKLSKSEGKLKTVQKERLQFQKQAARAREKEIRQNIRVAKSLDIEEQTRLEVLNVQKRQVREQAKENAAKLTGIKRTKGLTQSFKNFTKNILATTLAFVGFRKIFQLGKDAINMAAEAEGVVAAFEKLNNPNLLKELREATRGTVTDLELMKSAVKAKNFKIPLERLATFFEFATKRAAQTGESVDFLVDSIVNGIGRKSALVLDNLGISASELQKEMKLTGDFAAAAGNIIDRELGNMGDVALTAKQELAKMNAEFENLSTELGDELLPALLKIGRALSQSIKGWKLMIGAAREFFGLNTESEAQNRLNFWKKQIEFQDEVNKKRNFEMKVLSLKRAVIKTINKLNSDKTFLGIANKEGRELRNNLAIYKEQIKLLEALAKTDFFEGQKVKKEEKDPFEPLTEAELKAIEAARIAREASRKKSKAEKIKSDKEEFKSIQELELSRFLLITDNAKKIKTFKLGQQIESIQDEILFNNALTEIQKEALQNEIELLKRKKDAIIGEYEDIVKAAEEIALKEEAKAKSKPSFLSRLLGVDQDEVERIKAVISDAFNQFMDVLSDRLSRERSANDERLAMADEQIAKTKDLLKAETDRLKEIRENGQATDSTLQENLLKRLATEKRAKEAALAQDKRLKEKQKRLDIISAQINTFAAISNAYGSIKNTWLAIVMSAIMGALGLAQVANIQRTKYAKGTNYLELGGNPDGTDTIPIWADKGERIVPTKDNKGIPRTFPNSLLPTAVSYFLDSKSGTPILNARSDGLLSQIVTNTKQDGKRYDPVSGKLRAIENKYTKVTYS